MALTSSGFASPEQVAITKKHLQDTIARKKVVTDSNTVAAAQKAMDATGETGSNTRMGLKRQFKSEHSPSDRGPARGLRGSPEEAAAHEKTMNAAAAEKKEGRAEKKEAVISALQSGQEDSADFLERQRELQAVPKADEFERINLAEVFEL